MDAGPEVRSIVTVFFRTLSSLHQQPAEPGKFADDQTVTALEDVHQLVEPSALFGSLSRGGRLDEIVDAEVVFVCVLENGRRWLRRSYCAVETLK